MSTFVRSSACLLGIALFVSVTVPLVSKFIPSPDREPTPSEPWSSGQEGNSEEFSLGLVRTRPLLETRQYQVPPFFKSLNSPGLAASNDEDDPFAEDYVPPSVPQSARSAVDILQSAGIEFEEGASASYDSKSLTLEVTNYPAQLEVVDRFTKNLVAEGVPKQIHVVSTFVEVDVRWNWIEDSPIKEPIGPIAPPPDINLELAPESERHNGFLNLGSRL